MLRGANCIHYKLFKAVLRQIKSRETNSKSFPGLRCFEQGETFIPIDKIPGVIEAGWKPEVLHSMNLDDSLQCLRQAPEVKTVAAEKEDKYD